MSPYPLLFEPNLKDRVWGGDRLARLGKPVAAGARIGESWELADLPPEIEGGQSVIANGALAGRTLREGIVAHRDTLMGHAQLTRDGRFPLLIKLLDARENLSVQVHPDEDYVRKHPGARLKSEAWVIIAATPGAVIYKGLRPDVTPESFRADIERGKAAENLIAVPAVPGACHFLPSGTCHALGAGVLVAEVQTPSDTTFRVFDWGRPPGVGRELHLEQAMECIHFGPDAAGSAGRDRIPRTVCAGPFKTTNLADNEFFTIEMIEVLRNAELEVVTSGEPVIWMILAGSAAVRWADRSESLQTKRLQCVDLSVGATALMPARLDDARAALTRGTRLLRVTGPPRTRGMIA